MKSALLDFIHMVKPHATFKEMAEFRNGGIEHILNDVMSAPEGEYSGYDLSYHGLKSPLEVKWINRDKHVMFIFNVDNVTYIHNPFDQAEVDATLLYGLSHIPNATFASLFGMEQNDVTTSIGYQMFRASFQLDHDRDIVIKIPFKHINEVLTKTGFKQPTLVVDNTPSPA